MFFLNRKWQLTIVGWSAFVITLILNLILGLGKDHIIGKGQILGKYHMLGVLTAAIILTIINIISVLFTKTKSTKEKR